MYLKVTGGISYSQTHLAFQLLAPKTHVGVSHLVHSMLVRVNHVGTVVFQSGQLKLTLSESSLGPALASYSYCSPSLCLMV